MGKIYDNMSELVKRTLSGAVFVAAVVASILWSSYAFHVLFTLFCVLAVDEYHRLVKSPRALRIYSFTATLLLCVTIQCMAWRIEGSEEDGAQGRARFRAQVLHLRNGGRDEDRGHSLQGGKMIGA